MEYRIDFGGDPQDVTVTLDGVPDPVQVARCNHAIATDKRFGAGFVMLVDMTTLRVPAVAADDPQLAAAASRVLARDWDNPPAAVAFVVADQTSAETTDLWRAHLGGSQSRREIFRSLSDATAWLRTQRDG